MDFRIADTFTDSLARLTGDEQKAVKTTAFDLQLNPANPGNSFHKLDRARDKNFWSVRVNADLRLIVHKTPNSLLLCYVNHHDKSYDWAERRKLEAHPKTGAAQLVEIRETVKEVLVPVYVQQELPTPAKQPKPTLFTGHSDEELLSYGVPQEWLTDVRQANEDTLLLLADRLPGEAAEALLELATGGKPRTSQPPAPVTNPFEHPDALRRFRVMNNVEELQRALDYPWEKWTVFLHPEQQQLVEREFNGPARVSGSAGTGKTIVALHRAVFLARKHPESRVLLATFSETLAKALHTRLKRLLGNEPRLAERIEVHALDSLGARLFRLHLGKVDVANRAEMVELLRQASQTIGIHKFTLPFLVSEWMDVVDAWQLRSWEEYRDVTRLGRKTRLPEPQRRVLWSIFEQVQAGLAALNRLTTASLFTQLGEALKLAKHLPFDFAVVDESQDLAVAHLRFFAALGTKHPDSLFFAGDLGQRIFQPPFSWKSLGVDIRGRSRSLRVNYRTSHQIRSQADRLLGPELSDVDGNQETRSDTVSVFNGPPPKVVILNGVEAEAAEVAHWLEERRKAGILAHEMGVFVRSPEQLDRATAAASRAGMPFRVLDENVETLSGHLSLGTMHLAKGLEFRAVVVMACDDEVIPLQARIESVGDDSDLKEVYETERHLLYVACTRARDQLLVTAVEPASEFLDDLLLT
jgi:mRNA-degrading endonuclease RelE of RelBE toxin-antitoxin system